MLDYLKDIVYHFGGLGIDIVKLTGTNGDVLVEGIDENKTVVVKGTMKGKISELDGVFGLNQLDQLDRIIKIYDQKTDIVSVSRAKKEVNVEVRDDKGEPVLDKEGSILTEKKVEETIDQIIFFRANPKVQNNYRVVDRRMIPNQYSLANKNMAWDLVFTPSKSAIEMFAAQTSIGIDDHFGFVTDIDPETKKNNLYVQLGPAGNEALLEFQKDVKADFKKNWVWPTDLVLKLLKLGETAKTTISLLDKGVMKVSLDTGLAEYEYVLPAKSR